MLGMGELLVILCIVLLLFGGKKLPEFAKNLGLGIREFKKAMQGVENETPISKEETKSCCNSCPCSDEDNK